MQKRGQATIFIALGVIVLIIFAFLFTIRRGGEEAPSKIITTTTIEQVETFLIKCLESRVKDIFNGLNNNGGYVNINNKIIYGFRDISLFLDSDYKNYVPQISFIENSLKSEIENNQTVRKCYEDIKGFISAGFKVNFTSYTVDVKINDKSVDFDFSQDLILFKGTVNEVKNFRITISSELNNFLKIASDRVNSLINSEDFDLSLTLRNFKNIKGSGFYTKFDRINSDYEIFQLESKNNGTFYFAVYDPVFSVNKLKNGCCISKDGLCRQNFENCDGQKTQQDCNQVEDCKLGCCSIAQGSELKIVSKDNCLTVLSTELGNSFSSFNVDLYSNLNDDNLRQCNVEISNNNCNVNINDDLGVRNLNMVPYTNACSFRSSPDGEHYLLSCQNGEVKSEALGIDRLRVCHNNKKVLNDYQSCIKCGEPKVETDLLLYLEPNNRKVTSSQCGVNECLNKGLCKVVPSDSSIDSNIDCLPLYPPNNPQLCNECGKGEDEKANACNKEECESLGSCSAAKKPLILTNLKQPSLCASLIYTSILNPNAINFFKDNCNVNNEDLFKMFSKSDTYECKKELFALKECEDCIIKKNEFERCTEDSCIALNPVCKFVFNGNASCVRSEEDELNIIINEPQQNQLVSWNSISIPISLTTSKNAICRYSYNAEDKFNQMLRISDDFSLEHNGNLLIPYSPKDRLLKVNIVCLGEKSTIKTEFLTIAIEKKPDSALPLIEDVNQNKKVDVNENKLNVKIDKAVLGCNFIDISKDLIKDPGKINALIAVPPPANIHPGSCIYIKAADKSECDVNIKLEPNKYYFYILHCIDLNNIASEDLLIFFRT
ncbi:hypothetical protein HY498_00355 [Candidatus Woesearchaeota archaeon]|nr:hypothetical protein [Candidatus Woesearchaeota archaeon]